MSFKRQLLTFELTNTRIIPVTQDFNALIVYGKCFSGLTPELENSLKEVAPVITPYLEKVTNAFYKQLAAIPNTASYLEGRIDKLKTTHLDWLTNLFVADIDAEFAKRLYEVGDIHVKVHLPVEFMAGAMTLINNELFSLVPELFGNDRVQSTMVLRAISAITGLALMIMQKSYQESTITGELDKFLKISGMSRTLFTNLAKAYK